MTSTTWTHPLDVVHRRRWTRSPEPAPRTSVPAGIAPPIV